MANQNLTKHAAEALPESAHDRLGILEADLADALAASEADAIAYNEALPNWQNAKSTRTRNQNAALELGLEVDPAIADRDDRNVEKAKRRVDDVKARQHEDQGKRKDSETVCNSSIAYANEETHAANKRNRGKPTENPDGHGGALLTWAKPDTAFKFAARRTTLKLIKNETLPIFVEERVRPTIFAKRDESERIRGASPEPDDMVRGAMAGIDELRQRPNLDVRFWGGKATARLAEVKVDADSLSGRTIPVAPDFRPAYVREHYAEIESEVRKQVAAYYEENNILAMPPAEKRKRLEKLTAEILELEYQECEAIFEARKQGVHIAFRPDTDPRALLGIDGPPPKKQRR